MSERKPIIGLRFSRLIVVRPDGMAVDRTVRYLCICDCGNEAHARAGDLRRGKVQSCGCLGRERRAAAAKRLSAALREMRTTGRPLPMALDAPSTWPGMPDLFSFTWPPRSAA